ncbi:MAG: ketoacyl-ACP synthase III [Oscillospiraceae bacterium]|nr:ketoacyl-ACP synthase III [Oscillospiraceae bacterium]
MKNRGFGVGIIGTGGCMPQKTLTNHNMEELITDTSDDWIVKRTGIHERRFLEETESVRPLAVRAAVEALEDAGVKPSQIGMIIASTSTPEYLCPPLSSVIQHQICAEKCAAFDINAACTGFIYALSAAEGFITTGMCEYVLIICAESLSKTIDFKHRSSGILFGDGAGAAVVGKVGEGFGILRSTLGADGEGGNLITIPCLYHTDEDAEIRAGRRINSVWLHGSQVMKFASRIMSSCIEELLEMSGKRLEEVDLIIPHQANIRIIENSVKRIGADMEKVFVNLHKYGNMSSASLPVAVNEASREGRLSYGDVIIIVAFGGGLTYGAHLIRWGKQKA